MNKSSRLCGPISLELATTRLTEDVAGLHKRPSIYSPLRAVSSISPCLTNTRYTSFKWRGSYLSLSRAFSRLFISAYPSLRKHLVAQTLRALDPPTSYCVCDYYLSCFFLINTIFYVFSGIIVIMGMKFRQYLAGERVFGCLQCRTHLASIHSMISRVCTITLFLLASTPLIVIIGHALSRPSMGNMAKHTFLILCEWR